MTAQHGLNEAEQVYSSGLAELEENLDLFTKIVGLKARQGVDTCSIRSINYHNQRDAQKQWIKEKRKAQKLTKTAQAAIERDLDELLLKADAENVLRTLEVKKIDATDEVLSYIERLLKNPTLSLRVHDHITKAYSATEAERQEKFKEIQENIELLQLVEKQEKIKSLERQVKDLEDETNVLSNDLSEVNEQVLNLEYDRSELQQKLDGRPDISVRLYNDEKQAASRATDQLATTTYQLVQEQVSLHELRDAKRKVDEELTRVKTAEAATAQQLLNTEEHVKALLKKISDLEQDAQKVVDDKITAARNDGDRTQWTELFNNEREAKEKLQNQVGQLEERITASQVELAKIAELQKSVQQADTKLEKLQASNTIHAQTIKQHEYTIQEKSLTINRHETKIRELELDLKKAGRKAEDAVSQRNESEQKIRNEATAEMKKVKEDQEKRVKDLQGRLDSAERQITAKAEELSATNLKHEGRIASLEKERDSLRDARSRLEVDTSNKSSMIQERDSTIKSLTDKAEIAATEIIRLTTENTTLSRRVERYEQGDTNKSASLLAEQELNRSLHATVRDMSNEKVKAEQALTKLNQIVLHHGYGASLEAKVRLDINMNIPRIDNIAEAVASIRASFKNYPVIPIRPVELWLKANAGVVTLSLSHVLGALDEKLTTSDIAFFYDIVKMAENLVDVRPDVMLGLYALGHLIHNLGTTLTQWLDISKSLGYVGRISQDSVLQWIRHSWKEPSLPASLLKGKQFLTTHLPIGTEAILVPWTHGYVYVDMTQMVWMGKRSISIQAIEGLDLFRVSHEDDAIKSFDLEMSNFSNLLSVVPDIRYA